jgi:restriction system protein
MKWKMAENSLFAVLLRSQWWISAGVAVGIVGIAHAFLPADYRLAGSFGALPFAGIALWNVARRLRAPSGARVDRTLDAVRAMPWSEFGATLEAAWQRDGYAVTRTGGATDFELAKDGRVVVVAAKRWKVARTGVEPLRDLARAKAAREAHEAVWVTAGELTDQARAFAAGERMRVLAGADLARLLPDAGRRR